MKKDIYIPSADKAQELHVAMWEPEASDDAGAEKRPVGIVQIVHGMMEYIDRYEGFAEALVRDGWVVIGHDHLGHGKSGKWERGFFTEEKDGARLLIEDIHSVTLLAKETWADVPVFIFGHSMGSFFLRRYLTQHPMEAAGAVICGSGWYPVIATGTAYVAARIFSRIKGVHSTDKWLAAICSLPFLFAFKEEGKGAWLSKSKANVERYKEDPLCGFWFTCGAYRQMYENLTLVSRQKDYERLVPMPLLVIAGSDDPVGGRSSVRKIARQYRKLGFGDVTEKVVEGDRHEILFEDDAEETISFIRKWLSDRK